MITISPHGLSRALDHAPANCEVLSLDCFDTLLWRNTHAPEDVFADIGTPGGNIQQRRWAESRARAHAALLRGSNETAIAEIYEMLLPNAPADRRAEGVAAELAAETQQCFAFAPAVELMREAKRRGLRVIVVSDTYLNRSQLGDLIRDAAGSDVRNMIDAIFCSSEYGLSKSQGLFQHVLKEVNAAPAVMLHIGDNLAVDCHGAARAGIPTVHLTQFGAAATQRLRLEAAVSAVVHPGSKRAPASQPHRAQIALVEPVIEDGAARLGYTVLGPVLRTFDMWLREEAQALRPLFGGQLHMLFLMRDGFLPFQVFETAGGGPGVHAAALEVSRFAALASSFDSPAAVDRYLERELDEGDYRGIARQLLFDDAEAQAMIGSPYQTNKAGHFTSSIRQPDRVAAVTERSAAYASRLVEHVRQVADPKPGDTVMLVDLGYGGSVQSCIEPLLRRTFGIEVAGRYLLLREQDLDGTDKRGLFDGRHYDMDTLVAMCGNVAVLEQLCTVAKGSVVDYCQDGIPIRTEAGIKAQQSEVRDRVQAGCLRYIRDGNAAVHRPPASDTADSRRRAAAAVLARLMFLPMPAELAVLDRFQHDVNLGCGETVPLFDPAAAEHDLRRHGMLYLKDAERMYLPAELRGHGLSLSLSLLAQRRFGLDLRMVDFQEGGLQLPIIVADGRDVTMSTVEASRTHDGFMTAVIPVGMSQYAIGVQFGRLYDWVEIESSEFRPARALSEKGVAAERGRMPAKPSFEAMEAVSDRLVRCLDETAFMMVPPPPPAHEPMVLMIVFRPIGAREKPAAVAGRNRHPASEGVNL